jgi:hypothetical protein
MAKDRRTKDQKRKAKLAERAREHRKDGENDITPYEGRKYQSERLAPLMFATEKGIYEASVISQGALSNAQVNEAFIRLIRVLRQGVATLPHISERPIEYNRGDEVQLVMDRIRAHWDGYFDQHGHVPHGDRHLANAHELDRGSRLASWSVGGLLELSGRLYAWCWCAGSA